MTEKIICAGFGGQGIITLGKVIAWAGMCAGKKVTCIPKYGAEMRGGTAHCMVIISDEPISSPLVDIACTAIVMNLPSLIKFERRVEKGGVLFINSSLVQKPIEREDIQVIKIPATEIGGKLGNQQVANMVMLGAYIRHKNIIDINNAFFALERILLRAEVLHINKQAIEKGWRYYGEGEVCS
ncbi:MAG: 2-oxoacid:ferredoxin oxidoreductase subunit gamma [Candidatus Omnitrophota bacterium]|nr:MAG: 2-oxoacid:ferredoxin oxidoreductase subunit gamma [Candidatus Omnitrophota bacterium]